MTRQEEQGQLLKSNNKNDNVPLKLRNNNSFVKIMIGYLYFMQGIGIALCGTIPLTYKQIPNYQILGYFTAATLPFSFKFITGNRIIITRQLLSAYQPSIAPLIQKYSSINYGRRKLWIVISMLLGGILLYLVSLTVQDSQKQIQTAIFLGIVMTSLSIQDISLDALAIKQLRKPQLGSLLQSIFQQIGIVLGSLILGQLTSLKFSQYLGYEKQLFTPCQIIQYLIPLFVIPCFIIHFKFKQTLQVTLHYKHFILPKYKVCRQAILFLILYFGVNFFIAGYNVQVIKAGILSKQFIITLSNLSLLIIFPCTFILSKYVTISNLQHYEFIIFSLRSLLYFSIYILQPQSVHINIILLLSMSLLNSLHFYLNGIIMNSLENSCFQGMSATMMASMMNLGRNTTLQLNLLDKYGYNNACFYSFFYTALIIATLKKMHAWINNGQEEEQITKKDNKLQ